jgi:hypothetical protein
VGRTSTSKVERIPESAPRRISDCLEVIRLLLDGGADVDATNKLGYSPLNWSVERVAVFARRASPEGMKHFRSMLQVLLDHGARLDLNHRAIERFIRSAPLPGT